VISRRTFVVVLGAVLASPLAAEAQQAGKVWRIGWLTEGPDVGPGRRVGADAFIAGLREVGYVEGRNLVIEYRFADGRLERLAELAADLVRANVDVIAAPGTREALALKATTSTIPIVMVYPGDPVGAGLVTSLRRPGGNITGTSLMYPDLGGKGLELLRELVPTLRRVAILSNPSNASTAATVRATEAAAKSIGVEVRLVRVKSQDHLRAALTDLEKNRPDALLVVQDTVILQNRWQIAEFAERTRFVAAFPGRAYVEAGGLVAYGPDLRAIGARAAVYVDKILKGAKPADLPVEQPTKFELVINLKTAKALGLAIPPTFLRQADEVME
jgi:putative ABC transport system substrate-binding protein